jgi:uncharacterized phage-associated protein
MNDTIAIANFFIKSSFATGHELTPMKLIKLCYIAHGWHLGIYENPLLNEPVLAWKYGPVVNNVYHTFKQFGDSQITSYAYIIRGAAFTDEIDAETGAFLQRIWDVYKKYNGVQLSAMTHQKGTPWDIVWNQQNGKDRKNVIIPDQIIEDYYKSLMKRLSTNEPTRTPARP